MKQLLDLLPDATSTLCSFLARVLPRCSESHWDKCVLPALSYHQQRTVGERNLSRLQDLDLAMLLRVLDRNWYEISLKEPSPPEARHYIKEMQSVRNRWAHAGVAGLSAEDRYRDLDTLQRILVLLGSESTFVERVQILKSSALANREIGKKVEGPPREPSRGATSDFQAGQFVVLRSDPSRMGVIVGVTPSAPENRYSVFIDNESRSFYASQLAARPEESLKPQVVMLDQFHAHLTALQLCHPGMSTLYSLNAARIDFIPYQFRPVLKFIHSDRPRLLIADSVGVGKTIEAGLILRELQARRNVGSVLIICPRPLVIERKWETEMKRFDERFTHLNGETLRYCIDELDKDGEWPVEHAKTIIPYSLFDETLLFGAQDSGGRKKHHRKGILRMDPPPRFDLVIVDEAHHIRNTGTYAYKAVRFFCDNAEAVVFLTATPIQLRSRDLFVLLNTLRPDLIIDEPSYEHMAAPNPFLNQAIDAARSVASGWMITVREALAGAGATLWGRNQLVGSPDFQKACKALEQKEISDEGRVALIGEMERLHTFSGIINRTRRRDIGEFTVRKPETVSVEFTPEQRKLHDDLLEVQAGILSVLHGNRSVKFLMTTIRRQAASCLYGLAPFLEDILSRRLDEIVLNEADEEYEGLEEGTISSLQERIAEVIRQAKDLRGADPKFEALRKVISDKLELPNNKVMVFSSFRHTLRYLLGKLVSEGIRVEVVHGGTPDEDRILLRDRFRLEKEDPVALDVLLFSEIGCEGLDYQFCDCIVNYDLPWNPMRVEQRIGRIDRHGQKSEAVLIYNFVTPGTVDADIFYCCLERIGIFNRELGASEEILGSIALDIREVGENLNLTPAERQTKLRQISDNSIRLVYEHQDLEEKQGEFFGIRLPSEQARKEIEGASSYWLSPAAIQNLVERYLRIVTNGEHEQVLGEKPLKTLRISQEGRERLLADFRAMQRQVGIVYRQFENWLKGPNPNLPITFDASCASNNPQATFITPIHPLARQAAIALEPRGVITTVIRVSTKEVPAGRVPFAIYSWRYGGLREDGVLCTVAENQDLATKIPRLLEFGRSAPEGCDSDIPADSVFNELDKIHYALWSKMKEEHKTNTIRLANYRRESLKTSHKARKGILQDQLSLSENEKIRMMRKGQITAADADFTRRIGELDHSLEKADIEANMIACGVLLVEQE